MSCESLLEESSCQAFKRYPACTYGESVWSLYKQAAGQLGSVLTKKPRISCRLQVDLIQWDNADQVL